MAQFSQENEEEGRKVHIFLIERQRQFLVVFTFSFGRTSRKGNLKKSGEKEEQGRRREESKYHGRSAYRPPSQVDGRRERFLGAISGRGGRGGGR